MIRGIRVTLVFFLLGTITISYLDVFNTNSVNKASSLYELIMLITAVAFITHLNLKKLVHRRDIQRGLLVLVVLLINSLICIVIFDSYAYWEDLRNIMIPSLALVIGYSSSMSSERFILLFKFYGVLLLIVSVDLIVNNIGGLQITDDYKIVSKNALGAMIASYIVGVLPLLFQTSIRKYERVVFSCLLFVFFLSLLTIRARASTMTVVFSMLIFVYVLYRNGRKEQPKLARKMKRLFLIALGGILLSVSTLEVVQQYIYDSLFQNVESDVTTGRMERNAVAISFIENNLFMGRLVNQENFAWIHNYALRVLAEYGLWGGLVYIYIYLYVIVEVLRSVMSRGLFNLQSIGGFVMLPPIMLSFVEPLFPYGPGTSVFFAYFVLGYSFKQHEEYTTTNSRLSIR